MSIRGRNLKFIEKVGEILQVDSFNSVTTLREYKRAFTPEAVRRLNEEIVKLWPQNLDIAATLRESRSEVSGLYVGDYGPEQLLRGIVRHSTYASKLLVVDPFIYPHSVRDEYNPILNPAQHRSQTLKNVNLWFELLPWIEAGIVEVIRTPCDFDHRLNWDAMTEQQQKIEASPALKAAVEESVQELQERHAVKWKHRDLVGMPDEALLRRFSRIIDPGSKVTKEDLLNHVQKLRDEDPDFLEPLGEENSSQLHYMSSGAGYNMARLTASLTGSYLVTDLRSKWKEIELDREGRSEHTEAWSSFAKAIQETKFRYLDQVSLSDALRLRKSQRLGDLRAFMRRVWKQACEPGSFSNVDGTLLTDELNGEVRKADEEWTQIDRELLRNTGAVATIATSAPMIGSGEGGFFAAAAGLAGAALIATSTWQRFRFQDKYPAAFFLSLK